MHLRAGLVFGIGFLVWAGAAAADTYYKYRDRSTGRDVFVNRLEEVPRPYRSHAKIVLKTDESPAEPAQESPVEIVAPETEAERPRLRNLPPEPPRGDELRSALTGKALLRDGPGLASAVIDTKLVSKGAAPLSAGERRDFGDLLIAIVVAAIVAGLAALVAWIVILVTAIRDNRLWWAVFIFLFWPVGYVYVFVHGGKNRAVFKTLCTLGMLAPALVGLVGAWRFYAWFQAVIQARGGHI